MSTEIDRRSFVSLTAAALATLPLSALSAGLEADDEKGDKRSAVAGNRPPAIEVKQIQAGELNVGYVDLGPAEGTVVLLLHGWPYDIRSFIDAGQILASSSYRVIIPYLRGYGSTSFLSGSAFRNGQQSIFAVDTVALMDALKIKKAIVGGFDWGARTANILAAHWPDRCKAMVSVSGYLIGSQAVGRAPLPPQSELSWWYQFYFATERGRVGYEKYRSDFAKLIWQLASPKWKFGQAVFEASAGALNNPDHVDIVVHNYRWRLGMEKGESKYDAIEQQLARLPPITIPTVALEGDANGAPHARPATYAEKFTGKYTQRTLSGIGHNLPQEAPLEFARAIMEVDGY